MVLFVFQYLDGESLEIFFCHLLFGASFLAFGCVLRHLFQDLSIRWLDPVFSGLSFKVVWRPFGNQSVNLSPLRMPQVKILEKSKISVGKKVLIYWKTQQVPLKSLRPQTHIKITFLVVIVDFRSKLAEIVQVYTPYELDSHNSSEEISVANVPSLASKNWTPRC